MNGPEHEDQHAPLSYHGAWRIVWLIFFLFIVWLILRALQPVILLFAGLPRRNGPEPNRSLATQTWRPPLCQCDTADACTHRPDYHDHRVCNPAVDQPDAGTVAERTKTRARPSNPDRIAHAKLSGRSRGVARH